MGNGLSPRCRARRGDSRRSTVHARSPRAGIHAPRPVGPLVAAWMLAATAGGLAGCDLSGEEVCTLIDCGPSLSVSLVGTPVRDFTVTATADGRQEVLQCSVVERVCSVHFNDFTPSTVTITYETPTRTIELKCNPTYETYYPNGKRCGPTCRRTTVVMNVGP